LLGASAASEAPALDTQTVFETTSPFVWRTLHAMGVPSADIEDVMQEVYVVVHRRLASYDGRSKLTTWLFGICLRVAHRHRRRAYFRRERPGELPLQVDDETPEHVAARQEKQRLLLTSLRGLSPDKRAVFVWFEVEGKSCAEIADLMGVPVGTVYSRLHAARRRVAAAAKQLGSLHHE
jgi:RNA polymerase sigma-70 factor (ECF subfamily)